MRIGRWLRGVFIAGMVCLSMAGTWIAIQYFKNERAIHVLKSSARVTLLGFDASQLKDVHPLNELGQASANFRLLNTSGKTIVALRGRATIRDLLGETIYVATLEIQEPLGPGETLDKKTTVSGNTLYLLGVDFTRAKTATRTSLELSWQPEVVRFESGTVVVTR